MNGSIKYHVLLVVLISLLICSRGLALEAKIAIFFITTYTATSDAKADNLHYQYIVVTKEFTVIQSSDGYKQRSASTACTECPS